MLIASDEAAAVGPGRLLPKQTDGFRAGDGTEEPTSAAAAREDEPSAIELGVITVDLTSAVVGCTGRRAAADGIAEAVGADEKCTAGAEPNDEGTEGTEQTIESGGESGVQRTSAPGRETVVLPPADDSEEDGVNVIGSMRRADGVTEATKK